MNDQIKQEPAHQVMYVASHSTGQIIFKQNIDEWFNSTVCQQTCILAALKRPDLRGQEVWASIDCDLEKPNDIRNSSEHCCENNCGQIKSWTVTLAAKNGTVLFRRRWPVNVLQRCAEAVAAQTCSTTGDPQVIYWVAAEQTAAGNAQEGEQSIEFGADGDPCRTFRVPNIARRKEPPTGRILRQDSAPTDAPLIYVELSQAAWQTLRSGLEPPRRFELAWIGPAQLEVFVTNKKRHRFIYKINSLRQLTTDSRVANQCLISPQSLSTSLDWSSTDPVVLVHTHLIGSMGTGRSAPPLDYDASLNSGYQTGDGLDPSFDDYRCLYDLPAGSVGLIAANSMPLRVSVFGWPATLIYPRRCRLILLVKQ